MDIETRLKFGETPALYGDDDKVFALMLRGLFLQKNEKKVELVKDMAKNIDYVKAKELSAYFNITLYDFLLSYFAWLKLDKEFKILTEDNAKKVREMLEGKKVYFSK